MPPEVKRKQRENQFPFEVGLRGRKTGLTLPDTGVRDENGLEPMDHLFSSPAKALPSASRSTRRVNGGTNTTMSSEDMDVDESTVPDPTAVLSARKRALVRVPPRSKSPIKTYLNSPARKNPSLGPVSSPMRGTIVEPKAASVSASVRRRLNFSQGGTDTEEDSGVQTSSPQKRGASANARLASAKLSNATRLSPHTKPAYIDNFEEGSASEEERNDMGAGVEDSYQLLDGGDDDEVDPIDPIEQPEEEPEPEQQPTKKGRGRPKAVVTVPEPEPKPVETVAKKGPRGRPKRVDPPIQTEPDEQPSKRARRSLDALKPNENVTTKPKKISMMGPPKAKPIARKPKLPATVETDSPQIQRGPPMPRRAGLLAIRRETPLEGNTFTKTRSGRNSVKPLARWRNEKFEFSEDVIEDNSGRFLMPTIKGVVRVDEIFEQKRAKPRSKSVKPKRRQPESDDDEEEAELWESEPGRMVGNILTWDPDDPTGNQADEVEEELALSAAAIITRDVSDSSFKFAKTLTLPFFGSGMVDLPPGAMKKPKNSRKMQMAFFVFYGRVKVSINGNEFRIGKGGMFQVPRGNIYSIENEYDNPARIFFSQGCEVMLDMDETQ